MLPASSVISGAISNPRNLDSDKIYSRPKLGPYLVTVKFASVWCLHGQLERPLGLSPWRPACRDPDRSRTPGRRARRGPGVTAGVGPERRRVACCTGAPL